MERKITGPKNQYKSSMAICHQVMLSFAAFLSIPAPPAKSESGNRPQPLEVVLHNGGDLTPERLRQLGELGTTSIQRYIHWNDIETSPGRYDWSQYDRDLEPLRRAGLKWVPFVIAGPHYVTPEFVRQDPKITFYKCLEHGREDQIPSAWCPYFPRYIENWLKAFAEHYISTGMLESVQVGITGGYGEAIYPAEMGAFPPTMHHHIGMWCGDRHAVEDFRKFCRTQYGNDIRRLNTEWETFYPDFEVVKPFTRDYAPSPRAWLFLVAWYRDSLTRYADEWLAMARRHFKDTPIYLCTGGNMTIEHGTDFSAQAKVAAKYGAGLRVTNENVWFPKNAFLTRLVTTSCRFYGAFSGTEPASTESPLGTLGRLFNVYSSGARQIFIYGISPGEEEDFFRAHRAFLVQQKPCNELAALYPTSTYVLERRRWDIDRTFFYRVREHVDYDFVDERMIRDGALGTYGMLLVYEARCVPADVIDRIGRWVRQGGILIPVNSRPVDYGNRSDQWDALAGLTPESDTLHWGNGLKLLEPGILPSFQSLGGEVKDANAISILSAGTRVLLRLEPQKEGNLAWMRKAENGLVLAYNGPPNTATDPGLPRAADYVPPTPGLMAKPSLPVLFLRDVLAYLLREKRVRPGSIWLGDSSVFLTESADGDILTLNLGDKDATFERWGQPQQIPATSISLLERPQ